MRIAIYGAGAIGGYLGYMLAGSGAEITLIARGPHLAAIRKDGLTLESADDRQTRRIRATDDPREAGPQDYVVITLKAHSVPAVVGPMQAMLASETAVVTAVNGVPWWYFHGLDGPWRDHRLRSVDPGDVQWDGIGPERAIGCVVFPACEIAAPGVVRHLAGDRFFLGEPSGEATQRTRDLALAMRENGLKAPVRTRIRDDIWVKLWGNLCFNPVSALTGATLEEMAGDRDVRRLCRTMMTEARTVAETLGVRFAIDVDRRIDGAGAVGAHRTSMLQDLDQGRAMEIDALVSSVQELGEITGHPTPTIDIVLALVRQKAELLGLYRRSS